MSFAEARKILTFVEEIQYEQRQPVVPRSIRGVAAAVILNPYATLFREDLDGFAEWGEELANLLCAKLLDAMGSAADRIQSYGKGAIVGSDGELEHAAAIIHPKFGRAVREKLSPAKTLMPSVAKRGGMGTPIDIPLHHTIDEWNQDYFDAISSRVEDAPAPDEMIIFLALSMSSRPLARMEKASHLR